MSRKTQGYCQSRTPPPITKPSYDGPPGACFLDFDNDGKIDIFLTDNGAQGGMSLYRNLGNGKFEDVTKQAGLDPKMHAMSCTAGDYDNDGFVDLAVSFGNGILLLAQRKERHVQRCNCWRRN